jgi:transcriptional regulator with XRE-family HTH domain
MIRSNGRPPVTLNGRVVNIYAVSQELGVDQGYLSRILSGKRIPKLDLALRIAQAVGMDVSELATAIDARKKAALTASVI